MKEGNGNQLMLPPTEHGQGGYAVRFDIALEQPHNQKLAFGFLAPVCRALKMVREPGTPVPFGLIDLLLG